jgi:3-oxoacyl-[acyl-carrier protein] reductase
MAVPATGELAGRVALVTGGARGIGRGIALKLAQAGADVVVNYLERADAAHEVSEWIQGMGRRALLCKADVGKEAHVVRMFDQIADEFKQLDIVVNNVGPFMIRPVIEMSIEDWDLMLRGNLTSAFLVTRAAIPLIDRGENGGSIVFIGAPNAERLGSQSESCAYSIAKTGVVVLAQTLARDLGPKSIRVNVVNPGFIENDSMTPKMRTWMPNEVPLGKIGTPANIAEAVEFLVSARSEYISGAVLNVHGGLWI